MIIFGVLLVVWLVFGWFVARWDYKTNHDGLGREGGVVIINLLLGPLALLAIFIERVELPSVKWERFLRIKD